MDNSIKIKEYVNKGKKYYNSIKSSKKEMDKFFQKSGIYNKDGTLSNNYK